MKKLLTATIASLALFTFAPIEADAGGKKKNKRAKVHKHHNHNQHSKAHRGHNHSRSSVRFSFGQPAYRSYYRPAPRVYRPIPRVNTNSRSFYRPSYGFSGLSLFFGNGGRYCH